MSCIFTLLSLPVWTRIKFFNNTHCLFLVCMRLTFKAACHMEFSSITLLDANIGCIWLPLVGQSQISSQQPVNGSFTNTICTTTTVSVIRKWLFTVWLDSVTALPTVYFRLSSFLIYIFHKPLKSNDSRDFLGWCECKAGSSRIIIPCDHQTIDNGYPKALS